MNAKKVKVKRQTSTPASRSSKKKKCIAVTGGFGFLGSVIVRKLREQGYSIRMLKHIDSHSICYFNNVFLNDESITVVEGDVRDIQSLEELCRGTDSIIHSASFVSIVNHHNKLLAEINIEGTKNIVEICKKLNMKKLVYIGSVEAMGKLHEGLHDEREGFNPNNTLIPYGASKANASNIVRDFAEKYKKEHHCSASIVSPSGIIGPFDDGTSYLGKMVKMYLKRTLPAYPPKGGFCFVDVRDVANVAIMLLSNFKDNEYYLLAGEYLPIEDMMGLLQNVTDIPKPLFKVPLWLMYVVGALVEFWSKLFGGNPVFTTGAVRVLRSRLRVSSEKAQMSLGIKLRPVIESFQDQVHWYKNNKAKLE